MPDKINPKTGLPEKSKIEILRGVAVDQYFKRDTFSYERAVKLDPAINEYFKPINIDDYIEGGDSHFKQIMGEHELTFSNLPQLNKMFNDRLEVEKEKRATQLHDEQGIIERGAKGLGKFAGKTITNVVGGIVGTVYGAGSALFNWDMSSFYEDNIVFDGLDVANEWIDDNTVIYGEYGYHGKGFLDKLYTDPTKLFLDEGSNAASFVAGAIVTELLTSGLGTAGIAGQLGKLGTAGKALGAAGKGLKMAKGLDLSADAAKVMNSINQSAKGANYVDKLKKLGGTTRGLVMGSGYEAALEARENHDLVLENLKESYRNTNGKEAEGKDLAEMEELARSSSEWVFMGNIALVGGSNLLQFPKVFWKGYNGQKSLLRNMGESVGIKTKGKPKFKLDDAGQVVSTAGKYKALKYGYHALKNPVREGLEEVSQGVLNESTLDYYSKNFSSGADKEATSIIESFASGLRNMVSGPEGGNAFGMGFLMGLVGLPGFKAKVSETGEQTIGLGLGTLGGAYNEVADYRADLKSKEELAKKVNEVGGLNKNLKANYENFKKNMIIQQELDDALESGDVFRFKNLEHDQFYSYVRARQSVGLEDVLIADLENLRDNVDLQKFNADYGMEEVASFTEQGKKDAINSAIDFVNRVKENTKIVEEALERKGIPNVGDEVKDLLIHSASVLDNVDQREAELAEQITNLTNSKINPSELSALSKEKAKEYPSSIKRKEDLNSLIRLEELIQKKLDKGLNKKETIEYNKHKLNLKLKEKDIQELTSEGQQFDYKKLRDVVGKGKLSVGENNQVSVGLDKKESYTVLESIIEEYLNEWEEADPVRFAKHSDEVIEGLNDIMQLKDRREEFINFYNYLFTEKGQKEIADLRDTLNKNVEKERKQKAKEDAEQAETAKEQEEVLKRTEKTAPDAAEEVKTVINKKKVTKSKAAGKIDLGNIRNDLAERYTNDLDLFESEVNDLNIALAEADERPLSTDLTTFLRSINALSSSSSGPFHTVIAPFYKNISDAIETDEAAEYQGEPPAQASTEEDQNDTTEPEAGEHANTPEYDSTNVLNREYEIENGMPVVDKKADNFAGMTDADFTYVNNPTNLREGETVSFEIDLADIYSDNVEDIKIKIVKYVDGTKYTLGLLSGTNKDAKVETMRQDIYRAFKDSGQSDGVFIYGKDAVITNKFNGMVLNTTGKKAQFKDLQNPNDLNAKHVAPNIHGEILLGYGDVVNGVGKLTVPNHNEEVPHFDKVTPGAIYMLMKSGNGNLIPIRLKTRTINTEETQELVNLIQKVVEGGMSTAEFQDTQDKIKAITPIEIIGHHSGSFKIKRTVNKDGVPTTTTSDLISLGRFVETVVPTLLKQVSKEDLNKAGFNEGALGETMRVNLNMQTPIVNTNFAIDTQSFEDSTFKEYTKTVKPSAKKESVSTQEVISALNTVPFLQVNPNNSNEYIDSKGNTYPRVSTLKRKTEQTPAMAKAAARGTIIDDILRESIVLLNNQDKVISIEEVKTLYNEHSEKDNTETFTEEFIEEIHSILIEEIIPTIQEKGITLLSDTPTISGVLNKENPQTYAGTVDLLGYNANGNWYLIDLKTSTINRRKAYTGNDVYNYEENDAIQLASYQEMLKQLTGVNFKPVIFPITVSKNAKGYVSANASTDSKGNYTLKNTKIEEAKELVIAEDSPVKASETITKAKVVPKAVKIEPKGKAAIKKVKKPNRRFRIATPYTSKQWDSETELVWLKKNLPNVDVKVLKDLQQVHKNGGVEAWGLFSNAMIYLAENAGSGTAYHEAFHAVFNLMLTEKERQEFLVQAQAEFGLQDDIDLEEAMADAFMDYVVSTPITRPYKKSWLGRLFDRFMRMLNISRFRKKTINDLFEDINSGRFANSIEGAPIKRNVDKFRDETRFKVPGLNPAEKRERVDMIIHDFIDRIEDSTDSPGVLATRQYVKDSYIATMNDMIENPKFYLEFMDQVDLDYTVDQYNTVINNFEILFEEVALKLPSYGWNTVVKPADKTYEEAFENDQYEETTVKEGWQETVFEKSTKDTVTNKVKKALSRIENKDKEGDVIVDSLGSDTYVPYDSVFNSLKYELANQYTYSDMKAKMQSMVSQKPFIADVITMLDNDPELRSAFFTAMATQSAEFSLLLSTRKTALEGDRITTYTEFNIINPNRKSPDKVVSDNWKANFDLKFKGDKIKNAKPIAEKIKKITDSIETANDLNANTLESLSKALDNLGITFSTEDLTKIVTNENGNPDIGKYRKFKLSLNVVLNTIEKGNNPFESGVHREGKSIKELADSYVDVNLEVYEKSFKNVENKVIFSNILPNHISKLFSKLKKDNKTIDWYQKDPFYKRNKWLNDLREPGNKNTFEFSYIDGIKETQKETGTKYSKMSKADISNLKIQMYANNNSKDTAYYAMPILADAPQHVFVKFKKYSEEEVLDALYDVARQEFERNEWLKNNDPNIKNFKPRFVYMPFLKGMDINNKEEVINAIVEKYLQPEIDTTIKQFKRFNILDKSKEVPTFELRYKPNNVSIKAESFIKDYVYNTTLANLMSSQIFSGDLAYYKEVKNVEDFAKRNKQISNPGRVLDTTDIGDSYNTLYVKDEELPSKHLKEYAAALEGNPNKDAILAQYEEVNGTDAQAFISLNRYRDVLKGMGLWTDKHEAAYPRLKSGKGNTEDLGLFLQPIKPFYFGKTEIDGKIVPIQNKNSEYVVLPQMAKGNPKMEKMLDLFEQGIHSIQFESAVKVGLHKVTDFENLDVKNTVKLNNEDYGIQLEVPEHHQDTTNLFGTQIRKLIVADLMENLEYKYSIGNNKFNKDEIFSKYQDILSTDSSKELDALLEMFKSDTEIAKLLTEEVKKRDLGSEYLKGLELDENGKFKYPLFSPMHAKRNESLLNSLFTNRVIKQKTPGASLVQVSDYGLSDRLKVVMKDDGGVDYVEAVMPHYSKKYFKPYMDSEGNIDIARIEKENPKLLETISYRIPTEDKYSMLPIKIVGFSPSIAGGTIMLPADVTAITGSDFDIDKMFIMFNSFNEEGRYVKYDWNKSAAEQSKAARDNAKMEIIRGILTDPSTFDKWITPGGFEMIKEQRDRVAKAKGETVNLNVGLQSTYLELFNRNMSGKELIGIFANHNANHAILQHTEVGFTSPIRFNGNEYSSLASTGEETRISRVLAELLAAMVDNAKEPLAGELNINTFTADVLATIIRVGHPLEIAVNLINQPVILALSEDYYNNGGTKFGLSKLIKEYRNVLTAKAGIDGEYTSRGGFNINSKTLTNNLGKSIETLTKDEADQQLTALDVFLTVQSKADSLNKLLKAFRADSIGAGSTMAANKIFTDNKTAVIEDKTFIPGTVEVAFDKYSSMKTFADTIEQANTSLEKYFPWNNFTYKYIKDKIKNDIKGSELNESEAEFVNYSILSYLTSGFEFFNLKTEDFKYLVENFPAKYDKMVKNDPLLSDGLLLTKLIGLDTKNKPYRLSFNTNSKLSTAQKDQLVEDFEYLLSKEKYSELANDLIRYSFAVSGLRFTPNSFNNLIPVSILDTIKNEQGITLNEYMQNNQALNEELKEDFMDKFIRNNYYKFDYLPQIETKGPLANVTGVKRAKNNIITSVKVDIGEASDIIYTDEGQIKVKPYIKHTIDGRTYLYKLSNPDADTGVAIYNIMVTLGIPNEVSELTQGIIKGAFKEQNAIKIKTPVKTINYLSNNIPELKAKIEEMGLNPNDYIFEDTETKKDLELSEESTTFVEEIEDNKNADVYSDNPNIVLKGQMPSKGFIQFHDEATTAYIFDKNLKPIKAGTYVLDTRVFTFDPNFDTSNISDAQFKILKNLC